MCRDCAPDGGWARRRFLTAAGAATFGAAWAVPALAPPLAAAHAQAGRPEILPRGAWAGRVAPAGPIPPEPDVRVLVVHHTVHDNDYAEHDVVPLLRGMYHFHTGPERRWPDVAYNFVVDRFGRIWEARAGSLDGAVAGDATGGSQGYDQKCAFLGDHRTVPPSPAAERAMVALLAFLADRHRLETGPGATTSFVSRGSNRHPRGTAVQTPTLTGHRTMSITACPGDAAMRLVTDGFPAAVSERRATTTPTTAAPSTSAPTSASTAASSGTVARAPTSTSATTAATAATATTAGGSAGPVGAARPLGSPADDPVPWMVGGGAVAVVAGALLRLRSRR